MKLAGRIIILLLISATLAFAASKPAPKPKPKPAPAKALPKFVELGSTWCIPCKKMKPIVEDLEKNYKGKLVVVFVDIEKEKETAKKYGIRVMPTQVFIDARGKEFDRHEGFISKEDILAKFKARGYDLEKK